MGTLTARDLPAEIAYRIDERLGMLYADGPVPLGGSDAVHRQVHAEVRERWPEAYREAVATGLITPIPNWCYAHNREATHTRKDGRPCCDPKLGGILMPCRTEP